MQGLVLYVMVGPRRNSNPALFLAPTCKCVASPVLPGGLGSSTTESVANTVISRKGQSARSHAVAW